MNGERMVASCILRIIARKDTVMMMMEPSISTLPTSESVNDEEGHIIKMLMLMIMMIRLMTMIMIMIEMIVMTMIPEN